MLPGDHRESKAALDLLVRGRWVRLDRVGRDRYGRTLAFARVGTVDLSCALLAAGHAVYVRYWDVMARVRRCSLISRKSNR